MTTVTSQQEGILYRESKSQLGAPLRIGDSCTFQSFRTNNYKLHFLESPSGFKACPPPYMEHTLSLLAVILNHALCKLRDPLSTGSSPNGIADRPCALQIVLNTDANAGDLRDNLSYIYGLYVEYVMKNPLYTPGEPFRCD